VCFTINREALLLYHFAVTCQNKAAICQMKFTLLIFEVFPHCNALISLHIQ